MRIALIALCWCCCAGAAAQDPDPPGLDIFAPGLVAPQLDFPAHSEPGGFAPAPNNPSVEDAISAPQSGPLHSLVLEARLSADSEPVKDGVTWRVFGARPGDAGELPLLATQTGGSTRVKLASGDYLIHAAFGRAGATKRVAVADDDQMESLVLDAGGLKLGAVVGDDDSVPPERLSFEILQENESGALETVVPKASPGLILRLAAGTYHVVSRYGDVNAIVRADIEVSPGKLTEAVMRLTGAEVTLKLVSQEGGEALANTAWTVVTQEGNTVHESVGAFPRLILAEGTYTAAASHKGQIYSKDFTITSGVDRDVEVSLADIVQPEPDAERSGRATP